MSLRVTACLALAIWAVAHYPAHAQDCAPLPGLQAALEAPARILLFGEPHGSAEIPSLFGDAVCASLAAGLSTTVGLELQAADDAFIQRYIASEGTAADREALLSAAYWRGAQDGRTSVAMVDLIERLRAMKAAGQPITVISFQPIGRQGVPQNYYEIEMAAFWAKALSQEDGARAKLLILTGSVHANKTEIVRFGLRPAASHLPADEVISLGLEPEGGESWGCNRDRCGPLSVATGDTQTRSVQIRPIANGAFDGTYAVGAPLTVSPPAVGADQRVS